MFTSLGKILHASETITALLGYLPVLFYDNFNNYASIFLIKLCKLQKHLTNLSIFKIINEADHSVLQDQIMESKHSQNYNNGN